MMAASGELSTASGRRTSACCPPGRRCGSRPLPSPYWPQCRSFTPQDRAGKRVRADDAPANRSMPFRHASVRLGAHECVRGCDGSKDAKSQKCTDALPMSPTDAEGDSLAMDDDIESPAEDDFSKKLADLGKAVTAFLPKSPNLRKVRDRVLGDVKDATFDALASRLRLHQTRNEVEEIGILVEQTGLPPSHVREVICRQRNLDGMVASALMQVSDDVDRTAKAMLRDPPATTTGSTSTGAKPRTEAQETSGRPSSASSRAKSSGPAPSPCGVCGHSGQSTDRWRKLSVERRPLAFAFRWGRWVTPGFPLSADPWAGTAWRSSGCPSMCCRS